MGGKPPIPNNHREIREIAVRSWNIYPNLWRSCNILILITFITYNILNWSIRNNHPSYTFSAAINLLSFTACELESNATMVEEHAVSTVKHGPRREKTCEMRPAQCCAARWWWVPSWSCFGREPELQELLLENKPYLSLGYILFYPVLIVIWVWVNSLRYQPLDPPKWVIFCT